MWCRSAFQCGRQLIGSIRSDSSVRSIVFFSSHSPFLVGRSVSALVACASSRMSRHVASCACVRACVGYVVVVHENTKGCRAWSRSADDGGSAATTSCYLAPLCSTSTCSSECPCLFFPFSRELRASAHSSQMWEIKGARKRQQSNVEEGKGVGRSFFKISYA